jgi:hypothetical protein
VTVNQEASYGTNRIWTNNPTFLLSGQLTGMSSVLSGSCLSLFANN